MYTIIWFDGSQQFEVCTGNPCAAWRVYYALSLQYHNHHPIEDVWVYVTFNGHCVDPERGAQLPACDFKRVILAKGN